MQKPIVVARQEFLEDSVTLVNKYTQAGLPMFVVADILEELLKEVRTRAQEQYRTAKEQFDKAEAEEAEAAKKSEEKTVKKTK